MIKKVFRTVGAKIRQYFEVRVFNAIDALPNSGVVTLIDIGAAGEIEPRWKPYCKKLKYFGFEPDERSRSILNNKLNCFAEYTILPYAVADVAKTAPLYLCRKPQVSSLYEPNTKILSNFPGVERFDVMGEESLSVVPIDSLDINEADFMKIDIQGGELSALKGSDILLESILGLELEVEFVDLYKSQPLFGDICKYLSDKGFEFIDFVRLARWERASVNSLGQCVFGDGLFLRVPEKIEFRRLDVNKISSYFAILMIYRRYDLLERALTLLPTELAVEFERFEFQLQKARKTNNYLCYISRTLNKLISLFGAGYRVHVIY